MTEQQTRVVVIGGGYAGVIAANHLRLRPDVQITLVNPRPEFVERIRLHQLVTGSDDATVAYADILGDGIALVVDAATRIDTEARQVELFSGFRMASRCPTTTSSTRSAAARPNRPFPAPTNSLIPSPISRKRSG